MCKTTTVANNCKTVQQSAQLKDKALQLNDLRAALPEEVFIKDVVKSMYYFFFDFAMWFGAMIMMYWLVTCDAWTMMPFWGKAIASFVYWNIAGFFMWCLFVVGHDCGHGTFSKYEWFNDIIGHITHGFLLVPYWPWQMSHHRHHMYHNHEEKDYSHPWITQERYVRPDEGITRFFHENSILMSVFPFIGWFVYLFGMPDGSHFIPLPNQRLWQGAALKESVKCLVSSAVCVLYAAVAYHLAGNWSNFAFYYLAPLSVFGWWIVTVTYLQHHGPDTIVYDDSNWKFVLAAFETIDRKYGYGIDDLHHNISNGHVVHHLFFTKIPHYNLMKATAALRAHLEKNNCADLYKYEETYDFMLRVHQYFMSFGFRSHTMVAKDKIKAQ